jgi:type IV secretory pathway VirB2 component (pilin)
MNDQHPPLPAESVRLILIAAVAIALLGGLDWLVAAVCITAVVLYFAGWDLARLRAAARSLARTVIGE